MTLVIKVEDPRNEDMTRLLQAHLDFCYSSSPPESIYALDVEKLVSPAITVFGARIDGALVGVGAISRTCGVEVHAHSHLLQGERDRQSDGFSFAGAGQAERILSSESRDRHQ